MPTELRNFLALSYDELEELNLKAKEQRRNRTAAHKIQEERLKYLTDEKRIKAVTVLFSDLEGRLHMLDYDKKFLIKSWDNLTFDGSSIRGFTAQRESDLRLGLDWSSFYWAPSDIFGSGKVLVFGEVIDKGGTPYSADIRGALKVFAEQMYKKEGYTLNAANEIEGFLFQGVDAERRYNETGIYVFEFAGFVIAALGVNALKQEALNFIGGVERVAFFLVHLLGKNFERAANIGAIRRAALVNDFAKDQHFAGAKNIRWRPVEGAPVQTKTKIALALGGKAAYGRAVKREVVPAFDQEFFVIVQHVQTAFKIAEEHGDGLDPFFIGQVFQPLFLDFVHGNAVAALLLRLQVHLFQFVVRES